MATKLPKIKWELAPVPQGRYKSFEMRGWPSADYIMPDGKTKPALRIDADGDGYKADYNVQKVKTGDHHPLTLCIAAYDDQNNWVWRKLKQRFLSLEKAKDAGETAIASYQEFWPIELRPVIKPPEVKPAPPKKAKVKK